MENDIAFFEQATVNAERWADYFINNPIERNREDALAEALRRTQKQILRILLSNINDAISDHPEFNKRSWMKTELRRIFNNPDMITVDPVSGKVDIVSNAEAIAGDFVDFYAGVEAARRDLGVKSKPSATQKANFWKNVVWPTDYLYDRTIAARKRAWKNKAPWWVWLEYGNQGLEGAYPQFGPSNFVFFSQREAQIIFDEELENVKNEEFNIVEQAYVRFLNAPDKYKVRDVLGHFYVEGRKYLIYITPTRRLGVAQRIR